MITDFLTGIAIIFLLLMGWIVFSALCFMRKCRFTERKYVPGVGVMDVQCGIRGCLEHG